MVGHIIGPHSHDLDCCVLPNMPSWKAKVVHHAPSCDAVEIFRVYLHSSVVSRCVCRTPCNWQLGRQMLTLGEHLSHPWFVVEPCSAAAHR